MTGGPVSVFCVYGDQHTKHLSAVLIPSLKRATHRPIEFWAINYAANGQSVIDAENLPKNSFFRNVSNEGVSLGFAEGHNRLFSARGNDSDFIIINPDCVFGQSSIDRLLFRKSIEKTCGIVEARQWPWEHPKEYDDLSGETPWASGAAQLIDGKFYREISGMDERYFLYLEDVDLSWQAWLSGRRVIYERAACVAHYTNGPFYRADLLSQEEYYSLRNFLYIARKFFGDSGEDRALALLSEHPDKSLAAQAIQGYWDDLRGLILDGHVAPNHPQLKITGINRFHQLR
ncbi:MAG: glycosyltransferase family 2 protein [Comamonadaceae bacterium]|nr:MAG: glycosyltransferase family 2 protein [Comamonadaceae bacterium]